MNPPPDSREQARHISEVTKAFAEGKGIEFRDKAQTFSWKQTNRPLWDWDQNDYRVKPEERKPRQWEGITYANGLVALILKDANDRPASGLHVRVTEKLEGEVLPETETE